jgi:hypothetical protein
MGGKKYITFVPVHWSWSLVHWLPIVFVHLNITRSVTDNRAFVRMLCLLLKIVGIVYFPVQQPIPIGGITY